MTQKEIKVEFCLSEDQVIDNFTKLFKVDTFLKNISNTSTISNFSTKKKKKQRSPYEFKICHKESYTIL